ncbi:TadE family protein [Sulfitobacter sp. HNIBRBA3233]|uniref:TadE/TadG family type IV pilus assembly protein n=1 Tax=Sulfitobacter marinivivus TaxID=3158558 RepID=UPI0032DF0079
MIRRPVIGFARREDGAALVEFALLFPMFMLVLGLAVEGARTFWSYQTAITGVRDATRYLSRVVDADACAAPGGASAVESWDDRLAEIVREDRQGKSVFPVAVQVSSVRSELTCSSGEYRGGDAAVATVTATLLIDYPFSGLFALAGVTNASVTTTIRDSARIIGS